MTIFIAGMHRSGTSLTAQWLHSNGLFLGENLLSGFSDNKYGHFEDIEILKLVQSELSAKGVHPTGLILPKEGKEVDKFEFYFERNKLVDFVNKRRDKYKVWGWKEPRSTLFLNDLKEIIPELRVLAVYRKPELVIKSLYKRLSKNKWYYTRNPLKRLYWYFDIDIRKEKWLDIFEHAYVKYNQAIIDFKMAYPKDIFIVELDTLLKNDSEIIQWLISNCRLNIDTSITNVYDSSIMSKVDISSNEELFKNAQKVYLKLNHFEGASFSSNSKL